MPKPVTGEYHELMHYTTAGGLMGIVASGCLWATHAAFLNDAQEIIHFFDARLPSIADDAVQAYVDKLAERPDIAQRMSDDGGAEAISKAESARLVASMRKVTLAVNQPHIFSMSAARDDLIRRNGLLSQWRGYGTDGGYAIVFDTAGFERLLTDEAETHRYHLVQWGDVFYYGPGEVSQPSSEDVAELELAVRAGVLGLVRAEASAAPAGLYEAVTSLSCLYKHWGFSEEHEVRVIAVPANSSSQEQKPLKETKFFLRAGIPVPYIELFRPADTPRARLPIKRVIVGPHRDTALRKTAVERLLSAYGYDAEVECSEIPYIGR